MLDPAVAQHGWAAMQQVFRIAIESFMGLFRIRCTLSWHCGQGTAITNLLVARRQLVSINENVGQLPLRMGATANSDLHWHTKCRASFRAASNCQLQDFDRRTLSYRWYITLVST